MRARILVAVLVLTGTAGLTRADEKPMAPPALERGELDKRIVAVVYETAVLGTDLFNPPRSNHEGCARLYQGTLLAVVPLLDHRPKAQAAAKARLERARGMKPTDAAIELRVALDEIQNEIAPAKKDPNAKTSLWDRLGGEKGARGLVRAAWLNAAESAAPFRDKKIDATKVEQALVAFVSANSGGALKYSGADLKSALGGVAFSDTDFDTLTKKVVEQFEKIKVADSELVSLGKAWEGVRKDFVEKPKN
ncbi:hypothetical protein J8F10_36635 [Gemmata sp. G18]|uniref:Uncharacterized protein n=1 Tax=Gemmata palustris TaxID=2822762 RepID=A0ABS5C463_9BACT|nr:hypothetical protein [Gemmata palustris]MBP3960781.1 hypothetical protein [Gemmata palustris]